MESGMTKFLEILIVESSQDGNIGILLIDGFGFCWTLTRDYSDTGYAIAEGLYRYEEYNAPTYGHTFQILVEGHSALLFHPLNWEDESHGCVGLGLYPGMLKGKRAIQASRKAFDKFMYKMRDVKSGWLRIKRIY